MRGNAAEAAVLEAFVQRGFGVLLPFGGGHPYDLPLRSMLCTSPDYLIDRWTADALSELVRRQTPIKLAA